MLKYIVKHNILYTPLDEDQYHLVALFGKNF